MLSISRWRDRAASVDGVLHRTWRWPRRGAVSVTFGAPMVLEGEDYAALARRVEQAVIALQPASAEPGPRAFHAA